MKQFSLSLLAAVTLLASAACSEISTDPAPARLSRTANTVTVTYSRTASTIMNDTTLVNPRLDIFVLPAGTNADGTLGYGTTTGTGALQPFRTITDFSNPQPISLITAPLTVQDGVPSLGVRLVLRSDNRPGRRANSQRLTASLLINGGAARATATLTGTNFSRTAAVPAAGFFSTAVDANVAGYVF